MGIGRTRWEAAVVVDVLARLDAGEPRESISRATGVPAETVRTWQRGSIPGHAQRMLAGTPDCVLCGGAKHDLDGLDSHEYAYVLGVYLGDGHLSLSGGSPALRVVMDDRYPELIAEVVRRIGVLRGREPHHAPYRDQRAVLITSYWREWTCLLPQHGAGKKQDRPIVLAPWQQRHVDRAPGQFLRGLIQTDGWRGLNRVTVKGKDYAYPRYQFSSRSDDIRRLFTDTCDLLGVEWRPWGKWHISVARKRSVELLDVHVGPKS